MEIEYIIKRDYSTKTFHLDKITEAIQKAMVAVGIGTQQNAEDSAVTMSNDTAGLELENSAIQDRFAQHIGYGSF